MKIYTNPDEAHVEEMRKALKENDGYCPCSIERSEDTICMCKEFREAGPGMCHCGLYMKVEDTLHDEGEDFKVWINERLAVDEPEPFCPFEIGYCNRAYSEKCAECPTAKAYYQKEKRKE